MESTETVTGTATVTVTVRTGRRGSSGSWVCECGTSGSDGTRRERGRDRVSTVQLKQAAADHAVSCDGTWAVEH
ncbi:MULTISPECIES: hypothetical protein [unclassified Streptomyces]|uniref:hypothetical protein n=1 Tax=unclassified Streptomyces TaxID=2593676 RepID=UPI00380D66F4